MAKRTSFTAIHVAATWQKFQVNTAIFTAQSYVVRIAKSILKNLPLKHSQISTFSTNISWLFGILKIRLSVPAATTTKKGKVVVSENCCCNGGSAQPCELRSHTYLTRERTLPIGLAPRASYHTKPTLRPAKPCNANAFFFRIMQCKC